MTLKRKNIFSTLWRNVIEKSPTVESSTYFNYTAKYLTQNPALDHTICVKMFCNYASTSSSDDSERVVLIGRRIQTLLSFTEIQACWALSSDAVRRQSCLFLAGKLPCIGYHDHTASSTWARLVLITRKVRYSRFGKGESPLMLMRYIHSHTMLEVCEGLSAL